MKSMIVFALFVAAAAALPPSYNGVEKDSFIVKSVNDNIGVGGYNYDSETSNGIKQEESGSIKNPGTKDEALEVRGSFSYTGTDGKFYLVTYIANENGFQPTAEHLPVAPIA